MNSRINIDVKEFTALKQHFKHSKCFYPNCDEKTIRAHSIQENGPLKLICDKIESQESQVYYIEDELRYIQEQNIVGSHQYEYKKLRARGISEASTFRGFCQKHDKIFKDKIEDIPYSGTEEQQFLYMYRAFAYFIHERISGNKGIDAILNISNRNITKSNSVIDEINDNGEKVFKDVKDSLNNTVKSISTMMDKLKELIPQELTELDASIKFQLDKTIYNEVYDDSNFLCRSFDGIFPWASSSIVSYLDENMIPSLDGIAYSNYYAITVLPDKKSARTHILIGSLNETPNAKPQMERFRSMKSSDFRKFVSNLIIQRATNVYLSPRMISTMDESELKNIIEARIERHKFNDELGVQDYNFNLFSSKYLEF